MTNVKVVSLVCSTTNRSATPQQSPHPYFAKGCSVPVNYHFRRIIIGLTTALATLGGIAPYAVAAPQYDITSSDAWPVDNLGRPKQQHLDQAKSFAETTPLPDQLRAAILAGVAFYEGSDEKPVDVPTYGPRFHQFYWPSVATKCINGAQDSVASGIAVPGPTEIPAPGAKEGETTFVFTALGTGKVAGSQLKVHWFNLNNGWHGSTDLGFHGINPDGPATVSGTAGTGKGQIVAVIDGSVDTIEKETNAHCSFIPTAAFFEVT